MDMLPKIERMIELLTPEGAWTQMACHRTKGGSPTQRRGRAFSRCLYGAAMDACPESTSCSRALVNMDQVREISSWLGAHLTGIPGLLGSPGPYADNFVTWNDQEGRTQADILEFLHKCRNELINESFPSEAIGKEIIRELEDA